MTFRSRRKTLALTAESAGNKVGFNEETKPAKSSAEITGKSFTKGNTQLRCLQTPTNIALGRRKRVNVKYG